MIMDHAHSRNTKADDRVLALTHRLADQLHDASARAARDDPRVRPPRGLGQPTPEDQLWQRLELVDCAQRGARDRDDDRWRLEVPHFREQLEHVIHVGVGRHGRPLGRLALGAREAQCANTSPLAIVQFQARQQQAVDRLGSSSPPVLSCTLPRVYTISKVWRGHGQTLAKGVVPRGFGTHGSHDIRVLSCLRSRGHMSPF